MKSNLDKYVEEVKSGFLQHRGRASVYCFPPISYADVILKVIDAIYTKTPGVQVFIVVDTYNTRKAILDKVKKSKIEYNIKVLSSDYVKDTYKYDYKLIITVGINNDLRLITFLASQAKFMLCIQTKNIMDNEYINCIRDLLPKIDTTVSAGAVHKDNIHSPVEEYRVGVDLNEDDRTLYNKCVDYITTSISIFGDLSNIEKCKYGEPQFNISGAEFRDSVAKSNGWSNTLDTTVEWSKQIDDIYNPNVLFERANTFYNITRERKNLVTDNAAKLEAIAKIVKDNYGKKIMIVSKRKEFASSITEYLNGYPDIECYDYHDGIQSTHIADEWGDPILYKTGSNKGQPKVFGAVAIQRMNLERFNEPLKDGLTNCISIKNSSDIKLKTAIDVLIFTSAFVDDIIAFKTRFTDIDFNSKPTILFKVYCRGTIESKRLAEQKENPLITVVDEENDFVGYSDNNDDVYI